MDIVYSIAQHILPIEVKSGETITAEYFKGFKALEKIISEFPYGKAIVYGGDRHEKMSGVQILNIHKLHKFLCSIT